jgi:HSP20 family protein
MLGLSKRTDNPLSNISKRMESLFDDFFSDTSSLSKLDFRPEVDVTEDEKGIYVKADIPGLEQKDINVEVKDNVLTISGEKKEEKESKNEKEHRVERSYGSFSRSFTLPKNVDNENIKAKYKNGVLNIDLPKTKEVDTGKVNIEIE